VLAFTPPVVTGLEVEVVTWFCDGVVGKVPGSSFPQETRRGFDARMRIIVKTARNFLFTAVNLAVYFYGWKLSHFFPVQIAGRFLKRGQA